MGYKLSRPITDLFSQEKSETPAQSLPPGSIPVASFASLLVVKTSNLPAWDDIDVDLKEELKVVA
ncbi:hypothetical protein LC607_18090 [Nostoc sp. CHAB 5824]|nr:hypothetical protein [Nostoc sp. CHAB 5824]